VRARVTGRLAVLVVVAACARGATPQVSRSGGWGGWRARLDKVAAQCARIASCAHSHDPPGLRDPSTCVDSLLIHSPVDEETEAIPRCLRAADTCAAVDACLHKGLDPRAAAYCVAHPGAIAACDGDDLIECAADDARESRLVHCTALGARCGPRSSTGGLPAHACLAPDLCPEGITAARCDGPGAVVRCEDRAVARASCPAGTTCRAHAHGDASSYPMCEGPGHRACSGPGARRCDGDMLVECEAHDHYGHERVTDCRAAGLVCGGVGGRVGCAAGAECVPGPTRCEGGALTFCAAGIRERVACAAIGLGSCDPDARGAEAACAVAKAAAVR
jgi:hypothetical protein